MKAFGVVRYCFQYCSSIGRTRFEIERKRRVPIVQAVGLGDARIVGRKVAVGRGAGDGHDLRHAELRGLGVAGARRISRRSTRASPCRPASRPDRAPPTR